MSKLRSLQILRFIAAAMVVSVHALYFNRALSTQPNGPFGSLAGVGAAGVDIFFVLSGAIIVLVAFGERPVTAPEFLRRRFERIAPIYWLVTVAWIPFVGSFDRPITWASAAMTLSFWPAPDHAEMPILSVGWTLCFEMLFYICATAALASRKSLPAMVAAFIICWWARDATEWPAFQFLGNPIILEFMFGAIVAWAWRGRSAPLWLAVALLSIGATGLVVFCLPMRATQQIFTLDGSISGVRALIWGIPSGLLLLGALAIEPHLKGRWTDGPVFLGDASYAIYLTHWPFLSILAWALGLVGFVTPYPGFVPVLVIVALAGGTAVHKHIELPLLRVLRRPHRANFLAAT